MNRAIVLGGVFAAGLAVEGEQTFEIEGIGTKVVKAGVAIYTPPNMPHFGRNATDKISRTVVTRVKEKDKPISVEIAK